MTPEEKKIEKAANNYIKHSANNMGIEKTAFIEGAKSDAAKEYHTKGMWSNEEVRELMEAFDITIKFVIQFKLPFSCVELFDQNKKK